MKGTRTEAYDNSPLFNAVADYCRGKHIPFHMPGHKMGKGLPAVFRDKLALFDLTEIPGMDNLHFPEGVIMDAQAHAARVFGAERTFFLVNGSTAGIHAAISAICSPGEKLAVQRDSHRSVTGGLMLAGAEPVFISGNYDRRAGITLPPTPRQLEQLLDKHGDVSGVLLTRPGYYGQCGDICELVRIAHEKGKPVIVDEAHGAHLAFSERLPECALSAGADISVQSAHKTLPALTQGAFLHLGKGNLVDGEKVASCLRMLQTTSPSYLIMASLDLAAGIMEKNGEEMLGALLDNIECLKGRFPGSGIRVVDGASLPVYAFDNTRLVFDMRETGLSGFMAEKILRERYNIQVEMSDPFNIVCIATIADGKEELEALGDALLEISGQRNKPYTGVEQDIGPSVGPGVEPSIEPGIKPEIEPLFCDELPERAVPLCETRRFMKERVPLEQSGGRICADIITPYPPGIPVIWPGERIGRDMPARIKVFLSQGGKINGIYPSNTTKGIREDGKVNSIYPDFTINCLKI